MILTFLSIVFILLKVFLAFLIFLFYVSVLVYALFRFFAAFFHWLLLTNSYVNLSHQKKIMKLFFQKTPCQIESDEKRIMRDCMNENKWRNATCSPVIYIYICTYTHVPRDDWEKEPAIKMAPTAHNLIYLLLLVEGSLRSKEWSKC